MRIIFVLAAIIVVSSCFPVKKMRLCNCGKQYFNIQLKMNGAFVSTQKNSSSKVFILYRDGYVFTPGSTNALINIKKYLDKNKNLIKEGKQFKKYWGCFLIEQSIITMQYFYELHGGKFGVMELSGSIINNDSFVVTKYFNHNRKKTFLVQDTFLLKSFDRPDSTNWLQQKMCDEK